MMNPSRLMDRIGFALAGYLIAMSASGTGAAETVTAHLAHDGKALHPIVISKEATERERQAARTLADYLRRISGATFEVQTGDGHAGIAVGTAARFPQSPAHERWDAKDPTQREHYLLRGHRGGLYVIGNTEQAVEHAVWDLLYRLGHRQFFPGPTWEVIPTETSLSITVDVEEKPAYHARRIWYGYGPWDYAAQPYQEWCVRNRATSGIQLNTGHSYDGILSRNQAVFAEHPEYLGLVNGERKSSKFCISNPELRRLVVADALKRVADNPHADSLSMDPSDGGGWCECDKCKALGSVSDQALLLANEVAEAVNAQHGPKYVGMYAYANHSPPPGIKVHPRVIISVATSFIRGGYTVDQLMAGWRKQGATLGVREYYSVHTWDRDLPGAARGANLDYIRRTIPHFHDMGARFFSSEASDNWGPNGLGYYIASRILWDLNEAERIDELKADFLDKAFGEAAFTMAEFYDLIDGSRKPLMSTHLVGQMYRLLDEALELTEDAKAQARLHDLILYTRYVELWLAYSTASGAERQSAFEQLIRHSYRMRQTMMVHAKAVYRDVAARDKSVSIPVGATWNVAEAKNPWKNSAPFTPRELRDILKTGIANNPLMGFEPRAFSDNLVPAAPLKLPAVTPGSAELMSRGTKTYYTWVADAEHPVELQGRAGLIYNTRGPAKLALFSIDDPEGNPSSQAELPPDQEPHPLRLTTSYNGLHYLTLTDASAGTRLIWKEGQPLTIPCNPERPAGFTGRWNLYFYVPKGTPVVGGYASGPGSLLDGDGKALLTFTSKPGYFSVPVPAGQDGKLWKFHNSAGQRLLLTVPPYLARASQELLLPAEVVHRDAAK
ncbi:MAG: DUF4838 domain-containing protein [Gemmataceae bacterium]